MNKPKPFPTDDQLENFASLDRRMICKYLRYLCEEIIDDQPETLAKIRNNLRPFIPEWRTVSDDTLDPQFSRITNIQHARYANGIGKPKVLFSDIRKAIESKYGDRVKATNTYIFYFWNDDDYMVKPAVMVFDIIDQNWKDGILQYYHPENGKFVANNAKFTLTRLNPVPADSKENKVLYYSAMSDINPDHYTLLTIFVNSWKLPDRKVMFASYSVSKGRNNIIAAGIGLLVRVQIGYRAQIDEINKNGMPKEILNAVFNRRETLENDKLGAFDTIQEINPEELEKISDLSDYWIGYMYEKTGADDDLLRVKHLLMQIMESGEVCLFDEINTKIVTKANPSYDEVLNMGYRGFIRFSQDSPEIVRFTARKIKQKHKHNYRYQAILKLAKTSGKANISFLKGLLTGLDIGHNEPFCSPIFFERLNKGSNVDTQQQNSPVDSNELYTSRRTTELCAVLQTVPLGTENLTGSGNTMHRELNFVKKSLKDIIDEMFYVNVDEIS